MDPEVSVLLHCAQWRGLLQTQVHVELSERFNRRTDPALERHIEEVWTARLAKEPWLFNGTKFRLHSFSFTPSKHPEEDESRPLLTLTLGLTCYKDYLGTNWSSQVEELRQRGEVEHGDPLALLAQPLGVGAVMSTQDGQVVLIRRSQRVAEAGGLLDIPGGHPEPEAVCECPVTMATLLQRPEAVVSELFSSVCAEIRDEVNVPLCSLTAPVLMGVALNHTSAGRPSAEFYVSCSLTSHEVRSLYWKGGPEAQESTDIVFLRQTEFDDLQKSSSLWSELCPSAKGAVMLYQRVRPDKDHHRPDGDHHRPDKDHHRPDGDHHRPDGDHHRHDKDHHRPDGDHHRPDGDHHRPDKDHHRPDGDHHRPDGDHHRPDKDHHRHDGDHHRHDKDHHRPDKDHHRPDGDHHRPDGDHQRPDGDHQRPDGDKDHHRPDGDHHRPDGDHSPKDLMETTPPQT